MGYLRKGYLLQYRRLEVEGIRIREEYPNHFLWRITTARVGAGISYEMVASEVCRFMVQIFEELLRLLYLDYHSRIDLGGLGKSVQLEQ